MKKYLLPMFFAAICFAAVADDGEDNGDECHINGTETMDAVVVLNATSNAPAGAAGVAKIESENDDGNEAASLEVKVHGLDPGVYDVSIIQQSTGSNVDVGTFIVNPNTSWDDDEEEDHEFGIGAGAWISNNWGGFTNWGCWTNWNNTNFISAGVWAKFFDDHGHGHGTNSGSTNSGVTWARAELPLGVNPTDIAQIIVSDMNSNAVLVGDLVTPAAGTVINVSGTVQVTPGPGAPSLTGTANVQSTASKGKWKHQFSLTASGAAAKSNFKLDVNGRKSGAARSDKSGKMTIKKLPSHVPALRTLKLLDAQGNVVGSAKF
jgi:hypothetical protein